MRVLIVEDEQPAARRIQKLLLECESIAEIVGVISSVKSGQDWFAENDTPDVILSDIQLSDGLSFDIFLSNKISCPIIFTTAYNQYAIKAFELNSIDYLLKPINKEKLRISLQKLDQNNTKKLNLEKDLLKEIVHEILQEQTYRKRFLISKADLLIPILVEDIAYIFTEHKVIFLVTKSGEKFILNSSLDVIENELDPKVFFRLNRQVISNINAIEKAANYFAGKLKISLKPKFEDDIVVSRTKATEFKGWLNR